jgi:hypothetical protein
MASPWSSQFLPLTLQVTIVDSVATALFYLQAESLLVVYASLGSPGLRHLCR